MWNTDIFEATVQDNGGTKGKIGCTLGAALRHFKEIRSIKLESNILLALIVLNHHASYSLLHYA